MNARVKWSAAAGAGIAAGVLATVFEIVLWAVFTDALPEIFFRDAHFAAAIIAGPGSLSPPASFAWGTVLVATLVHFTLSIAYGLILSTLISRLRTLSSLIVGAAFGLFLYGVNMYGFTTIFPWFEATRDWITVATHVAFGIVAAGAYRALARRRRSP
jgi:hypothetical protein